MLVARLLLASALLAAAPGRAWQPPAPLPDPLEPVTSGGLEALDLALAKLAGHRRLLVVGAHPDDEDNALLTWIGRGLAGEAAYFSLSRGEGGQNLIGGELGVELGILRTGELEAARRIEGTRQHFARAYDFGYTRSLDETLERWPREVLLEDAMRAIRRFKPQVIVAIFPGDERAGHGQHQASGLIAREAFAAARAGRAFPALDEEGLAPWVPSAFYQRAWSLEQATAAFELGALEPVSGRTLGQIAAASRSLHRSQDMGREQRIGRLRGGVVWEAGDGEAASDPFAGIDTRLEAIAGLVADPGRSEVMRGALRRASQLATAVRAELTPESSEARVAQIAEIHRQIEAAREVVDRDNPAELAVRQLLDEKWFLAGQALAAAAGVLVDATVDRERVVPGETLEVTVEHWSAGVVASELVGVFLAGPLAPVEVDWDEEWAERTGVVSWRSTIAVADAAEPTIPYYLRRPRRGDLYDWSGAHVLERGEPRQAAPLTALIYVSIAGQDAVLPRAVVHRYADQALGEVRRPLRVVPALEVAVEPDSLLVNRLAPRERRLEAVVKANTAEPVAGVVRLVVPAGWQAAAGEPLEARFTLDERRREQVLQLPVVVPAGAAVGRDELAVEAVLDSGAVFARSVPTLEYPHVDPTPVPRAAAAGLSVFDLALPDLGRLGYVRGASDRMPAVLSAIGLPVEVLDADELARGDLSVFDVIVVGSRAYEVDPALAAANGRLLDYAHGGGTLVVQYQQYQFVVGGFAPYALSIGRPHGRVTDETVPVEVLEPGHPAFNHPNRIEADDWEGWVQERGLYFADSWDNGYRPLLALADPGRDPERGALLVAPLGRGVYVYTGLSFFRQLPAGVPGALRLFANLLALEGGK